VRASSVAVVWVSVSDGEVEDEASTVMVDPEASIAV